MNPPCYILLDFDGVLNRHGERHSNGYNGTHPECVANFNRILREVPDAKIVVISSWRYDVHSGRMTVAGIEAMMKTHGIDCHGCVFDVTETDAAICGHARSWDWLSRNGGMVRRVQIYRWLFGSLGEMDICPPSDDDFRWCVLDDLDLSLTNPRNHVRTDPAIGLTSDDADRAIAILRGDL